MEKESVKKFDLEAAFKALDEIEIPEAKGIKANRVDLKERFSHKPATETLVEDYYDVASNEDLEEAKEERDGEIAQAKLARIEKIVDLDAESPEDLQPSYVGKVIMQCPQCMTLFYKDPEDIEHSEENPDVVNINEPCQHCGNTSGYTLIGKVGTVSEDEADKYEEQPSETPEENELDLDFDETSDESAEEASEESSDEDLDLDLDLDLEESLNLSKETSENETEHKSENLTLNEGWKEAGFTSEEYCDKAIKKGIADCGSLKDFIEDQEQLLKNISHIDPEHKEEDERKVRELKAFIELLKNYKVEESLNNSEAQKDAEEGSELKTENESENLTLNEEIDKDLDKKLAEHNDYIEYLKNLISQDEEALKKAENEEIKAAIQRHLDTLNADLEAALPDALKADAAVEEPVDTEIEETEAKEEQPVKEISEEEPKEDASEEVVEEALTEETEECKVVLSDEPEKEVFAGSKEDCEKIIEKNKDTNTAKEHGLEIVEPAVDESLNTSEVQKDAEEGSELKTENESENLTLNESLTEGAEAEIDAIIASWGDVSESLNEEGNLDKLLDSDEFKTPVSDEEINAAREDVKEESLEECNKQKLTEEPDPEVSAIIDSWEDVPCEGSECEEGYTGNPAERTTHLEYTDDDPTDGKAVLPDNIEKQLTEDAEEEVAEEPAETEQAEEATVEDEPKDEEEKEELPNVDFNTEEVKEVAEEAVEEVIKEAEAEVEPEVIEEKVEEVVADAVEEKVEAEEEIPAEAEEVPAEVEEPEFSEDAIDDLDECSLNKHIDEYLKEVYSNVKCFEATGCEFKDKKLFIEGKISFNSGKEKLTMFEFLPAYCEGKLFFEGINKDFSEDKAFTLNCSINESKTLITESFGYKYKINENLVEGLK